MKRYILLAILTVLPNALKAQYISPTNLIQLLQYFQTDDNTFARSTNEYLVQLDKNWSGSKVSKDASGELYPWYYSRDKKVYLTSYCLAGSIMYATNNAPSLKVVTYSFIEKKTWKDYLQQMKIMQAVRLSQQSSNGGKATFYAINNLQFCLTEYPPGINGTEASYEVAVNTGVFKY